MKGRLLGFSKNVADSFCYLILTNTSKEGENPKILSRPIVRPRNKDKDPPVYTYTKKRQLIIFKHDNITPLDNPDPEIIEMIVDFAAKNNALEEDTSVKRKLVDYFEGNIVDVLGPPTKK